MSCTRRSRAPPAGRGARRTRAPAPRARGRASPPAPGATNGSSLGGTNPHSAPTRARRRPSGSRARAPAAARRAPRLAVLGPERRSRCRRARRPGPAARSSGPPSPARPMAGSARLPTITGCTNSTATWRTSERAAGERAQRDQPPAAGEALGHAVAQARDALRLGAEERLPRAARRRSSGRVARRRRRHAGAPRAPAAGSSASQSRNASTPSPVRALTSMCSTPGMDRVEVVQEAVEVEVDVRRAGRSC